MELEKTREEFIKFLADPLPISYGQKEMFYEVWEERPHLSEISYEPLYPYGYFKWHWQFAHILPKGTFPKMKLFKPNIMLMTDKEHERQETHKKFLEQKQILNRIYYEIIYDKKF